MKKYIYVVTKQGNYCYPYSKDNIVFVHIFYDVITIYYINIASEEDIEDAKLKGYGLYFYFHKMEILEKAQREIPGEIKDIDNQINQLKKLKVVKALQLTNGNVTKAAEILHKNRKTIYRWKANLEV